MTQCIEIESLSFTYLGRSEPTLRWIDLRVLSGELVLLTGPTGCGKSTLLRTINGLIPHASGGRLSGCVRVNGAKVAEQPLAVTCQQVGLLFQNPDDQLFCIVVEDEIAFGLENLGLPPPEIDRRIDFALEQVGLPGFRGRQISSLSSGQKQRVALASLWAMQPQILLLDEPTSYLDPQATLDLLDIVRELNESIGATVIIAGHQVNEIAPLCHRVWLMNDGEIVSDLPSDQAFFNLEPYRQLGVQVPELAQIAERVGLAERPLTLEDAVQRFRNDAAGELVRINEWVNSDATNQHRDSRQFISANDVLIDIQDLTFRYPRTAADVLEGISFQVKRGEVVAIMGANGSGKTTLLLLMVGLFRPSAGGVIIDGRETGRYKPHHIAGRVGVVFQNPDLLLQAATVSDEIAFGPKNLKLSSQEIATRLEDALQMFDLVDLSAEAPYALSRGQRQRTAVAATFSLYPELLLLDEPTTGQDQHHLHRLMTMLCDVMAGQNKSVIFSTHDANLTLKYANRVLLLHRGELVFDGRPDAAFANPELLKQVSLVPPLTMQLEQALENGK